MKIFELEGVTIVSPSGNLDIETSKKFKEVAFRWCEESQRGMILDLREVDYIDSIGLGSVVSIFNRCVNLKKKMVVVLEDGEVKNSFHMAKLDKLMDIYENISNALGSFD